MAPRGGGERYPHKPLLLLWLLGRMQQHGTSACAYDEAEQPVSRLLDDFGPPSKQRYRAAMPFAHLESDLWEIAGDDGAPLKDTRASLRRGHASGRLRPEVEELFRSDPSLLAESGALGLHADLSVRVSPQYVARSELGERLVYHLEGRSLLDPAPKHSVPSPHHIDWHSKQVFKDSA